MGPKVKFVSPICDLISKRKNRGGLAKDHKKYGFMTGKQVNIYINPILCPTNPIKEYFFIKPSPFVLKHL